MAVQVERVADLLLSLAEEDDSAAASTDGWSLDREFDELVGIGISVLFGASGLALWYFFG